jgi:hypothetical protein
MSILAVTATGGLDALGTAINAMSKARESATTADSYISFTQPARVEPITLIDTDCLYSEILPDTMQSLLSQFAAFYLQAFSLSTNVGSVNVARHLDKLSPARSPIHAIGLESSDYLHRLPMPALEDGMIPHVPTSGKNIYNPPVTETSNIRDGVKEVKELSNLSVGKLLNVEIQQGEQKATIPISIRLMSNSIPSDNLVHILSAGNKDTSFSERWHGWKSGRLEFIRDLILCQDLIDEHKTNLIQDKSGIYTNIVSRRSKNLLTAMISGNVSIGSASNLCIISDTTAAALESRLLGKLSSFKVRQKVFEETYLMILVVIDKQWDRATFYYRGMPESSSASARDLQTAGKGSGTDVMSILSAFREGKSVAL